MSRSGDFCADNRRQTTDKPITLPLLRMRVHGVIIISSVPTCIMIMIIMMNTASTRAGQAVRVSIFFIDRWEGHLIIFDSPKNYNDPEMFSMFDSMWIEILLA
jgi:hypothetical protein